MQKTDKARVVEKIGVALNNKNIGLASSIARKEYSWAKAVVSKRRMSQHRALSIFMRDGFIDRYSGSRLIFPGVLLVFSQVLPENFPAHATWRVSETHDIYWELWPAVDHIVPLSKGGKDIESNFATTSTLHNSVKGHWTLDQIGWELLPGGDIDEWDGMLGWFVGYIESNKYLLEHTTIRGWYSAAIKCLS